MSKNLKAEKFQDFNESILQSYENKITDEFIIDDEKNKKGMYFPNTSLKILSSNYLCDSQSKLCLLGINPSSEHKIIKKFDMFKKQKGKFLSIYPDSKNFIINNYIIYY